MLDETSDVRLYEVSPNTIQDNNLPKIVVGLLVNGKSKKQAKKNVLELVRDYVKIPQPIEISKLPHRVYTYEADSCGYFVGDQVEQVKIGTAWRNKDEWRQKHPDEWM